MKLPFQTIPPSNTTRLAENSTSATSEDILEHQLIKLEISFLYLLGQGITALLFD